MSKKKHGKMQERMSKSKKKCQSQADYYSEGTKAYLQEVADKETRTKR